jgi:hypothetical protein
MEDIKKLLTGHARQVIRLNTADAELSGGKPCQNLGSSWSRRGPYL